MRKIYRRVIFWVFFVLFVVSAPAAILYSQGYRFDQYRQIFIHSGSITVKSIPSSANVYLNGELQTGNSLDIINNSFTLNGLRPGDYTIRVSANGYRDWEKQVGVHSGISTEFWSVFLAPDNPPVKELSASNVERFFPSPFGKHIAFVSHEQDKLKIFSYDGKNDETLAIFEGADLEFSKNKFENIEWNFKERLLVAPVLQGEKRDYLISDTEKQFDPALLSNLAGIKLQDFHGARWSPDDQWTFYFLARNAENSPQILYSYNVSTKKLTEIASDALSFDFSNNNIYLVRTNNVIYKIDLEGKEIGQITLSPVSEKELGNRCRLIVYDDNRQAVISEDGMLFVYNNDTNDIIRQIADNVIDIQFSDDGKKLLFWNNNEIDVLFLRPWEVQPQRKENEIQKILRSSAPLENVFWFRDYEHVLFSSNNKIKIIELDPRDHRTSMNIFENNLESFSAAYDSRSNNYYYVGDGTAPATLYQMQLLPRPSFFGG